jgi:hypothetical protein
MARKTATVTINEGRDKGRVYKITEWSATRVEDWILRAIFGLGEVGVELPPELLTMGAAPIMYAIATQVNKLPSKMGVQLAGELMECVQIVEERTTRSLEENDIEDVSTRFELKKEVLKLIFGFTVGVAFPSSPPASAAPSSEQST